MPGHDDAARAVAKRRRQRWITGAACVACIAVLVAGWDAAAYLYFLHRFRTDPAALCAALFQGAETPRGRAAREWSRAREREVEFARDVAGGSWWAVTVSVGRTILGRARTRDELRAVPSGRGYELWTLRRSGFGNKWSPDAIEATRRVDVVGPFLRDVDNPGRVDSWGVLDGKLVLGALVQLTPRDWILVQTVRTKDDSRDGYLSFSFDPEPTVGGKGRCRHSGLLSGRTPVILANAWKVESEDSGRVQYEAMPDVGADPERLIVTLSDGPRSELHLDTRRGIGWLKTSYTRIYENGSPPKSE